MLRAVGAGEGSQTARDSVKASSKPGLVHAGRQTSQGGRPPVEPLPGLGALPGAVGTDASPSSARMYESARNRAAAFAERLEKAKERQKEKESVTPRLTFTEKELEMRKFLTSHTHDERLKNSVGNQAFNPTQEAESEIQARLQWRQEMDRSLKRLMIDMEFAECSLPPEAGRTKDFPNRKVPLPTEISDFRKKLAMDKTDRVYDWYNRHGNKQVRKEREGPSYLRYDPKAPPIPGSLRR